MHPAIYVSLVNVICEENNWTLIKSRIAEFEDGVVDCCSAPVVSVNQQSDVATQIKSWWQAVEQRSLMYSLNLAIFFIPMSQIAMALCTHIVLRGLFMVSKKQRRAKMINLCSAIK